jgi:hypothetical protein
MPEPFVGLLGAFSVLLGVYGIRNPDSGRVWGTRAMWEADPEGAKDRSRANNRILSILFVILGLLVIVLSVI